MIRSLDWPPIERLPETPGAIVMTGTGYVIDGKHVRTVSRPNPTMTDDRSLFARFAAVVKSLA